MNAFTGSKLGTLIFIRDNESITEEKTETSGTPTRVIHADNGDIYAVGFYFTGDSNWNPNWLLSVLDCSGEGIVQIKDPDDNHWRTLDVLQ